MGSLGSFQGIYEGSIRGSIWVIRVEGFRVGGLGFRVYPALSAVAVRVPVVQKGFEGFVLFELCFWGSALPRQMFTVGFL